MINDKENAQLPEDDEFPSIEELFARKRKKLAEHQENKENDSKPAVEHPQETKADPEIPASTPVLFLDGFSGDYIPGKILGLCENSLNSYEVASYTGEIVRIDKHYICTTSNSRFYTVKLRPKQKVMAKLEPALTESDEVRLQEIISKHKEHLKNVLLGKIDSERDTIFLHKHKSALYHMNTRGPFTKPEYSYITTYLSKEFRNELGDDVEKAAERFSKCKLDFKTSFSSYAQLVLAPELVVCHIIDEKNCIREESEAMLQDYDFHPNISYIQALYTQREVYRYARLEKKSKLFL